MEKDAPLKEVHLIVYGDVQSVFYRATSEQKAEELGITGWVKNLDDGTVEILAQGQEDKLKEFVEWCKHGPTLANVEKVYIKWEKIKNRFSSYNIRY